MVKRRISGIETGSKATATAKEKEMVQYTSDTLQTAPNPAYEDVTRLQKVIYENTK